MRRIASVLLVLALGRPAGAEELKIDWFALDVDLGGGVTGPDVEGVFLGRVRAGYVRVRGALLSSIGGAAELKDMEGLTLGVGQLTVGDQTTFAVLAFARLPLGAIAYKLWGEP